MLEANTRRSEPTLTGAAVGSSSRDRGWDILLVFVALYATDAVGHMQELFPVVMPLKLPLIAAALASLLYVADGSGIRRLSAFRGSTTTAVFLLLAWAVLSVPFALNRGTAFLSLTQDYYKSTVLYVLIAGTVRGVRDVERLALLYYASIVFYAAMILARFAVGGSNDWRLGVLYYYDANDFATLAVTAIPLGLYFGIRRGSLALRVASGAGLAVLTAAFVRAGSRGGFLAMLALGLYVLLGFKSIRTRWRTTGVALVAVVLIASASGRFWTQMQTIVHSDQDYNQTSETGRMHIWARGIGYMLEHPIFGVGLENFGNAEGTISPLAHLQQYGIGVKWNTAHNSFVLVGAELGIPGLVFFVTMLGGSFAALTRVARTRRTQGANSPPVRLAEALTGSLVGFVVGCFFLSLAYHQFVYALVALCTGLAKVTVPGPRAARPTSVGVRAARRAARAAWPSPSQFPPT